MAMPGYDSLAPAKRFGAKVKKIVSDPTNYSPVAALAASAPGMLDKLGAQTASYGSDMRDSAGPGAQDVQLAAQTAGQGIGTGFEPDAPVAKPVASAPVSKPVASAAPVGIDPSKISDGDRRFAATQGKTLPGGAIPPPAVAAGANPNQSFLDTRVSVADQANPARSLAQANELQKESGGQVGTMKLDYGANSQVYGSASQPGGKINNFVGIGANVPAPATGPTDAHGNLIVVPTSAGGSTDMALGAARDAAGARGDWGAVQRSFNTPAQNDANDAQQHLTDRAMTGNLGAQRILQQQMQGQNALATGAQQGQFGMDRAKLEMGSPLHQAQVDEAGARTKLYGAQQGEYEQKVAMQKRMDSIDAELMTPGITAARTKELQAAKSRTRNSLGYDLKFDPETNQLVRLDKTTGETGPAMPKAAPTREGALAAVKAGAPKDEVNKRLVAAGLPPI